MVVFPFYFSLLSTFVIIFWHYRGKNTKSHNSRGEILSIKMLTQATKPLKMSIMSASYSAIHTGYFFLANLFSFWVYINWRTNLAMKSKLPIRFTKDTSSPDPWAVSRRELRWRLFVGDLVTCALLLDNK